MECQSTDRMWQWSCTGLDAHSGQCGADPSFRAFLLVGFLLPVGQFPTEDDGSAQGERYGNARGEILRPLLDQLQRRRSASARSSIKNESVGSEDDQTPS